MGKEYFGGEKDFDQHKNEDEEKSMKKYLFGLVLLLFIGLCGCNHGSDEQQRGAGTGIIENTADRQEEPQESGMETEDVRPSASDDRKESGGTEGDLPLSASDDRRESGGTAGGLLPSVSDDRKEGAFAAAGETWEEAYRSIIRNIDSNLSDPYNYNFGFNGHAYLGIHDFDDDGIPELIMGDAVSAAVFTYEDGNAVKVTDLYEPEDWGGINGLYYKDNQIVLVNNGSWGSGYVCFTYDESEGGYVIGVYDDYNPDKGIINGEQVTGEAFRQQFNLAELTKNSRVEYSKITEKKEIILAVNGESTAIDDLDFQLLKW